MVAAVPAEVVEAAVRVCGTAFHYKGQLKALLVSAGVPADTYARWAPEGTGKYAIARSVLADMGGRGPAGQAVVRRVVTDLANMTGPDPTAPDQDAGRAAIADLRRMAVARRVLLDADDADRERRRRAQDERVSAGQNRDAALAAVSARLVALTRSTGDVQRRGYDLERLLVDLFAVFEIAYRPPYRLPHEQHDGAFEYRSFTYLVEARWRAATPVLGDFALFKAKVDGKLESTRGMFVSMAGFDHDVVDHFAGIARGSGNNLLLVDGQDLAMIVQGRVSLPDALDHKIRAASQEGRWWAPLAART